MQVVILASAMMSSCTKPVVTVGQTVLTKKEISYREKIVQFYFPDYKGDITLAATQQLVNAYTYAEILKNNGVTITDEKLKAEDQRILKNTLVPDKLQKIKDVFEGDDKAYLKIYVLPVYVERIIYYDFFLKDERLQKASWVAAQNFLTAHEQDSKLAKGDANNNFKFTVSLEDGVQIQRSGPSYLPESRLVDQSEAAQQSALAKEKFLQKQKQQESVDGRRWVDEVVKKLKPNQFYEKVIDQNEVWWVVRYLGPKAKKSKSPTIYEFEGIVFPKANYEKWLTDEKAKVHVEYKKGYF